MTGNVDEADSASVSGSLLVRRSLSVELVAVTVAAAAVLIVAASAVAWDGTVSGWEADVLESFNGWPGVDPVSWTRVCVG